MKKREKNKRGGGEPGAVSTGGKGMQADKTSSDTKSIPLSHAIMSFHVQRAEGIAFEERSLEHSILDKPGGLSRVFRMSPGFCIPAEGFRDSLLPLGLQHDAPLPRRRFLCPSSSSLMVCRRRAHSKGAGDTMVGEPCVYS